MADLGLGGAVTIVTGGANGIGLACATLLAKEGAAVTIFDKDESAVAQVVTGFSDAGAHVAGLRVDVTDPQSVDRAVNTVAARKGVIDILVCCAGIADLGERTDEIEVNTFDRTMEVNVKGQWLPIKYSIPFLRRSSRASVVIIASDSSIVATTRQVAYCASKGAVSMMTKAIAIDLLEDDIRVNCVSPSIADTGLARGALGLAVGGFDDVPYPVQSPIAVANCVLFLCSPIASSVNAHSLVADFGYSAKSSFPA